MKLKAMVMATSKLPQGARQAIFDKFPAPYEITGVVAGATDAVHEQTIAANFDQYCVPIDGQADVLVTGNSVH